jgi:hypothetical protein
LRPVVIEHSIGVDVLSLNLVSVMLNYHLPLVLKA